MNEAEGWLFISNLSFTFHLHLLEKALLTKAILGTEGMKVSEGMGSGRGRSKAS